MTSTRDPGERRRAATLDLVASGKGDAGIEIVEYSNEWPARFSAEQKRLTNVVPALELHHIGSTAVPGLAAKPTIDMMALVEDLDAPLPALVERAGYQYPEAYNATLTSRRWLCHPSPARRTHHLHLVAAKDELTRHLSFRDALRADAELRDEYAALKQDLARRMANDREGYTAAKSDFINRVEADA